MLLSMGWFHKSLGPANATPSATLWPRVILLRSSGGRLAGRQPRAPRQRAPQHSVRDDPDGRRTGRRGPLRAAGNNDDRYG
jgi:hypothetical protein